MVRGKDVISKSRGEAVMPLQFRKQIKLGDFIKLNINKKSVSLSAGVPGLHFTIGRAGQ